MHIPVVEVESSPQEEAGDRGEVVAEAVTGEAAEEEAEGEASDHRLIFPFASPKLSKLTQISKRL